MKKFDLHQGTSPENNYVNAVSSKSTWDLITLFIGENLVGSTRMRTASGVFVFRTKINKSACGSGSCRPWDVGIIQTKSGNMTSLSQETMKETLIVLTDPSHFHGHFLSFPSFS